MLKRVALVLATILALATPVAVSAGESRHALATTQTKDCVVYITRTGHRYHQGWCRYLRLSKIPMPRSEAIRIGYTPCRVCGGSECER